MLERIAITATLVLSALATLPAVAQTGPVRVIDGDTIDVAGTRIRLWGIDAPEAKQMCERLGNTYACGQEATAHLRALVAAAEVVCEARVKDRYGRTVAICRVGLVDVGAAMVRDGWALAFVRYSADYAAQEQEARLAGRGMWAGTFTFPWEWRATRKSEP
jgi:endonuclease YncB( thermonuclease family)